MKIEKKEQTAQMSEEVVQNNVGVKQDSVGFIINLMSSKLYKNRRAAFLREILSNAIDSNAEAKVENPVLLRIYLDENRDFHVQIRDFGVGLSVERFEEVYINIASSTKRQDNTQQGGFGIGRFAALSYANYASVTSFYEGIRYEYAMYHDGDSTSVPKLGEAPTDEPNGVLVDINFKSVIDFEGTTRAAYHEVLGILSLMLGRFSYFQNVFLELDFDFNDPSNISKHDAFCRNQANIEYAVKHINNNLVLNKEHYIFSKNAFINGLNTNSGKDFDVPHLKAQNEGSNFDGSEDTVLHIVVGENVYYPLSYGELAKHLDSSNPKYIEHVINKMEEYKNDPVLFKKYEKILSMHQEYDVYGARARRDAVLYNILKDSLSLPVGIKIPIGVLDILPSREEFIYNRATINRILDIIFIDFLPEIERDLVVNNVVNFDSYTQLLDFYKDSDLYETIGDNDTMMLYVNHEEKLKIHLPYKGKFQNVSLNDNLGFKFYTVKTNNRFKFSEDNSGFSAGSKRKIVIKQDGSKIYTEYRITGNNFKDGKFSSKMFISVKNKQVDANVINRLLKASVSDEVFADPTLLGYTPLFQEYNSGARFSNLFVHGDGGGNITALAKNGTLTKRFAKYETGITGGGRDYSFYNIIKGNMHVEDTIHVLADVENLKPMEKAFLLSEIAKYPFSRQNSAKRYYGNGATNDIIGAGQTGNPVVHFYNKSSIISREDFCKGIETYVKDLTNLVLGNRWSLYSSPSELFKKMIKSMKEYQLVKKAKDDTEERVRKADKALKLVLTQLRCKELELNDQIKILNLRIKAIRNNEGSYSVPITYRKEEDFTTVLDWEAPRYDRNTGAELFNFKTIQVSSSDISTLEGLRSKLNNFELAKTAQEKLIKEHKEKTTRIRKGITDKYYTKVLKDNNIKNESFTLRNDKFERDALVLRDPSIFQEPEEITLYREKLLSYYTRSYDMMIKRLFVDFTDVKDVTPEFEEFYLNEKKESREAVIHSVMNINQLSVKNHIPKGYDFHTTKTDPQEYIESVAKYLSTSVDAIPLTFVYGSINKSKQSDEVSPLVGMFLYVSRFFETYVTTLKAGSLGMRLKTTPGIDTVPQFVFLDIPSTKHKYVKNLSNFIHIEDFMENLKKYRQIKRLNTALLIESKAEGLTKLSLVIEANPHIFRANVSNKLKRLANFMKSHTSHLSMGTEEIIRGFKKEMLSKAIEENNFDLQMLALFQECEKELKDMNLILACSQEVLETSFYSTTNIVGSHRGPEMAALNKTHMAEVGWFMNENSLTAAQILTQGEVKCTGSGVHAGSMDSYKIHPIVGDFLVKTLKERKNIIPTYQACNQSVVNLGS